MAELFDVPEADDEGIWYKWRCPSCQYINESENDTRGEVVECDNCGESATHGGG